MDQERSQSPTPSYCSFSPCGKYFASISGGGVTNLAQSRCRLWSTSAPSNDNSTSGKDSANSTLEWQNLYLGHDLKCVRFVKDVEGGRSNFLLVCSSKGMVAGLNISTGKEIFKNEASGPSVESNDNLNGANDIVPLPKRGIFYTIHQNPVVKRHSLQDGTQIGSEKLSISASIGVANEEESLICFAGKSKIVVWDIGAGNVSYRLSGSQGTPTGMCFCTSTSSETDWSTSKKSDLVVACYSSTVAMVWNLSVSTNNSKSGKVLPYLMLSHHEPIIQVQGFWSKEGKIFLISGLTEAGSLVFWRICPDKYSGVTTVAHICHMTVGRVADKEVLGHQKVWNMNCVNLSMPGKESDFKNLTLIARSSYSSPVFQDVRVPYSRLYSLTAGGGSELSSMSLPSLISSAEKRAGCKLGISGVECVIPRFEELDTVDSDGEELGNERKISSRSIRSALDLPVSGSIPSSAVKIRCESELCDTSGYPTKRSIKEVHNASKIEATKLLSAKKSKVSSFSESSSSVAPVIMQALVSEDKKLLETALEVTDQKVIMQTVWDLPALQAVQVLEQIVNRVQATSSRIFSLGKWIHEILKQHAGYLASIPHSRRSLEALYLHTSARLQTSQSLIRLQGRVDTLLAQGLARGAQKSKYSKLAKDVSEALVQHTEGIGKM